MKPLHNYPDLVNAAIGLLCNIIDLLSNETQEFAIIGGWSPYFLNSGIVKHPGSRDVDVLFKDGSRKGVLNGVIKILRSAGYVHSAKHEFQLLKILQVAGESFVFNVDLLHASESVKNPEMFVDQISLPVRVSEFSNEHVVARSIVVPISQFIFDGHIVQYEVKAPDPYGNEISVKIPLMDELGTIVTKAQSMLVNKRRRDAFDVVLAIRQARNRESLIASAKDLKSSHPEAFGELKLLRKFKHDVNLRANVEEYWGGILTDTTWDEILSDVSGLTILATDNNGAAHRIPSLLRQLCRQFWR